MRVTRSRDIRAPNLDELYQNSIVGFNSALDPQTNTTVFYLGVRLGNLNLKPEKADTTNIGIVLQPSFLPGFTASVDWWNIDLKGGIATISEANTLLFCFRGQQQFCNSIVRNSAGVVTQVSASPFNYAAQTTRGMDFEGSYRMPVADLVSSWSGDVALHANATLYLKNYVNSGVGQPTDDVGQNSGGAPPNWRLSATLQYSLEALSTSLTARAFSSGTINNDFIECTAGCPTSTPDHRTITNNHLPGALYFDASVSYTFNPSDAMEFEAFLNVKNLLNAAPAIVPQDPTFGYNNFLTNVSKYDALGRVYRAGVRFKL